MIMKKALLLLFVFSIFLTPANASHLEGGEITWECITSGPTQGMYIFTQERVYFII